jgi:hypothetical protein
MEGNLNIYEVVRPDIQDLSISVVSKTETKEHVIKINSENTEDGEECGIEIICDSNKDLRNALLKIAASFQEIADSIQNKCGIEAQLRRETNAYIEDLHEIESSRMGESKYPNATNKF